MPLSMQINTSEAVFQWRDRKRQVDTIIPICAGIDREGAWPMFVQTGSGIPRQGITDHQKKFSGEPGSDFCRIRPF
jgi:hypothetical protein